jgi:hypothetical protein
MTDRIERGVYEFVEVPQHVLSEEDRNKKISYKNKTLYLQLNPSCIKCSRVYFEEKGRLYKMTEESISKFLGMFENAN